jgi:hypothetical protein
MADFFTNMSLDLQGKPAAVSMFYLLNTTACMQQHKRMMLIKAAGCSPDCFVCTMHGLCFAKFQGAMAWHVCTGLLLLFLLLLLPVNTK